MNKAQLYAFVREKRRELGINLSSYPLHSQEIAGRYGNLVLQHREFSSKKIGGMLVKNRVSVMTLNTLHSQAEQNFYGFHELVHFWDDPKSEYLCIDGQVPIQDRYIEWKANEGAAEMAVPFETFLPDVVGIISDCDSLGVAREGCLEVLSWAYKVSPSVIDIRLQSLAYELWQHSQGTPVENVVLMSANEQKKRGVIFTPVI